MAKYQTLPKFNVVLHQMYLIHISQVLRQDIYQLCQSLLVRQHLYQLHVHLIQLKHLRGAFNVSLEMNQTLPKLNVAEQSTLLHQFGQIFLFLNQYIGHELCEIQLIHHEIYYI